tara:strand:- start:57 stop:362 length:306 start_codon:yes stop_codon:yes gene_type:complete
METLPEEIWYNIILLANEPYSENRKNLMKSIRKNKMKKLLKGLRISICQENLIYNIDGTINELCNYTSQTYNRKTNNKYKNLKIGPLAKIRNMFNKNYNLI